MDKTTPADPTLRVWGTSRVADNARVLMVSFNREPTDDELREIDDYLKERYKVQSLGLHVIMREGRDDRR